MNYFELYQLPVRLSVDKAALKKKYLELSRQHHPDFFLQQGNEAQAAALEQSAFINKGYKTLGNRDETIRYVLELKDLLAADEKHVLPPHFLMEMMELNEAVEAANTEAEKAAVLHTVSGIEDDLYAEVRHFIETYEEGNEAGLLQVKEYYFKKKYLERIKQQLG